MSQFPCATDGARIYGAAQHFYLAVCEGSEEVRCRKRFCSGHMEALLDTLQRMMVEVSEDVPSNSMGIFTCAFCGRPDASLPAAVFSTLYLANVRHDFYGRACGQCALAAREAGAPDMPLAGS